jgi:hypothetical protein
MTETICAKSKLGHSLGQISKLTGLTIDEVKERLGKATGLTPEALSSILHMKQRGLSLELISQELDVELEVLKQFLPQVIKKTVNTHALADQGPYEISLGQRASPLGSPDHCKTYSRWPPTRTEETKQPPTKKLPEPEHTPTFFYSCEYNTNKLRRVNLENSPAMKCLIIGSKQAFSGVSCPEEVYFSLVDYLEQGRQRRLTL